MKVGTILGIFDGFILGTMVGNLVGFQVGVTVGKTVGSIGAMVSVGTFELIRKGLTLGIFEGI